MVTMKEMIDGVSNIDARALFEISDKLWHIGGLEETGCEEALAQMEENGWSHYSW